MNLFPYMRRGKVSIIIEEFLDTIEFGGCSKRMGIS